ncbi:preprotein translocase subunit SecY [Candidatus Parcubacteria bacterium]|nr:preprotein translocase subunit SecY [Candidatus Parcubacteria bacterium]
MITDKLVQIWKARDLRKNIFFVLIMLVIFRLAAHIPVPGVDVESLKGVFEGNQVMGLLNIFSGGGMQNFSIVMMGIAPYITSSIIFQLLGMIVPKLEELQKEESGRQKINMWTRWLTVPLAMLQSFGMITLLRNSSTGILTDVSGIDMAGMLIIITAGTIFLMWIGELITEKNIGNGISLLIFAGIVSSLPQAIMQLFVEYDPSKLFLMLGFVGIAIITVVGVVIITEGQRNIPVQYAKQIRGNRMYGGTSTHLPLRVNMAGVIPIIFAISVVLFPPMIAQFFMQAKTAWLVSAATGVINIFNNQLFYGVVYFLLVFAFTFFYTEVIFHPNQIAENLQKQGGFIPGIRPGKHTSEYLANTTHKIIFVGALFLGLIAILPLIMQAFTGMQSLAIGGTSLLIVVAVVIETVKQIESQLTMREYEGM